MKKIIRTFVLAFILMLSVFNQTHAESSTDSLLNVLIKIDTSLSSNVTKAMAAMTELSQKNAVMAGIIKADSSKNSTTLPSKNSADIKWPEWLLIYFPILFFMMILWFIFKKLKKDKIALKDFLIDKEVQLANKELEVKGIQVKAQANNGGLPDLPPALPAPVAAPVPGVPGAPIAGTTTLNPSSGSDKNQSVSRLIAFLCGFTSVSIAVCICTVYFYNNFTGNINSSMDNLSSILYGLGLGVIPYGFNKISSVLKSEIQQ